MYWKKYCRSGGKIPLNNDMKSKQLNLTGGKRHFHCSSVSKLLTHFWFKPPVQFWSFSTAFNRARVYMFTSVMHQC